MPNFQREGSVSNSHVGKAFEKKIKEYFNRIGISLKRSFSIDIGIDGKYKAHKYDLGSSDKRILVECKSHKWTEGKNVPSAKITTWDQAMYYFYVTPGKYRKIFVVLKDWSEKRQETLCEYYLRTKYNLIPNDVEIWEYDEESDIAVRKK